MIQGEFKTVSKYLDQIYYRIVDMNSTVTLGNKVNVPVIDYASV